MLIPSHFNLLSIFSNTNLFSKDAVELFLWEEDCQRSHVCMCQFLSLKGWEIFLFQNGSKVWFGGGRRSVYRRVGGLSP